MAPDEADEGQGDNFIVRIVPQPDQQNNYINRRNGNRGCHNPFTIKEWIILVCVMLTVGFGIFLGSSILASYINRQTTPSKYVKKVPSQLSHLTCYQCSWSVNVENKSPILKERNCSSNPKNIIECKPGDYCGLRYLEYFGTGSKFWERACLKRAETLNPGEHICIDQTIDNINHTICRCNKELCLMQKFDAI